MKTKFLSAALGIALSATVLSASAQKSYTEGLLILPKRFHRGNICCRSGKHQAFSRRQLQILCGFSQPACCQHQKGCNLYAC